MAVPDDDMMIDRGPLDRTIGELRSLYRGGEGLTEAMDAAVRDALRDLDHFPSVSRRGLDVVIGDRAVRVLVASPAIHAVLRDLRAMRRQAVYP